MPDTGNVPIQILQGGTTLNIASGGSIVLAAGAAFSNTAGTSTSAGLTIVASGGTHLYNAGGSLQVANGGAIYVGSVNGFNAPGGITLGGTQGKWSYGTFGLTSGVGTVATGLTTVVSAQVTVISAVQGGLGSLSSVVVDNSLFSSGSIIMRGLAGTLAFSGAGGTVCYFAMGL